MPNRILADSILSSETLNELCPEQECLWYRLLVSVDDYGCMDARPLIVLARCYPLRIESIQPSQIETWIHDLARVGLLTLYRVDGKDYLQVSKWEEHQRVRNKRHKCPLPAPDGSNIQHVAATLDHLVQSAAIGGELRRVAASCDNPPSESLSLSLSLSESLSKEKDIVGQKKTPDYPYAEIIDYLNAKAHTMFKPSTDKTQTLIRARAREGFTLENFKTVIDNMVSVWYGDAKMQTYLRPETLFGTKFESYLTNPPKRDVLQRHMNVSNEHDFDGAEDHIHAN
jgi:uncharacterized phage protein (TIGR02220 family)